MDTGTLTRSDKGASPVSERKSAMQPDISPKLPRVAVISQGLGRISPPTASGSIAIWTYETAHYLARDFSMLLIEFGIALATRPVTYKMLILPEPTA